MTNALHQHLFSTGSLTRRRAVTTAVAGIAMLGTSRVALAAQEGTPQATPVTSAEATFLFVQSGFTGGTLAANADGTYLLTLAGAPEQTVYFSDRPERLVGATPTDRFLAELGFDSDDPPNAALAIQADAESTDVIVLELTAPVYDPEVATLVFTATVLDGVEQLEESGVGFVEQPLTADALPQEFGSCSLFIDDSPWDPRGDDVCPGCAGSGDGEYIAGMRQ